MAVWPTFTRLFGVLFGVLFVVAGASIAGAKNPAGDVPRHDVAALRSLGIRQIGGQHLTLYTDLRGDPSVDELPRVFDQAVPQWCRYFEVALERTSDWHVVGYVIQDKEKFRRAGLLPASLPPFLHGFQRGPELWIYEQPSAYYRRHLLLHEGTHAFTRHFLGDSGPPWYMEGMAELLGTHRWSGGKLTLKYFPADKRETPSWGRIKLIKDEVKAGRGMRLTDILAYDGRAHLRIEPYAWCWAATAFFDAHPLTQPHFRELRKSAADPQFGREFLEALRPKWHSIDHQWRMFVMEMDYGYDLRRGVVLQQQSQPLPATGGDTRIASDRGWQASGWTLRAGTTYRITASGRYQIGRQQKIWWCEPGGVTIHYHRGRPIGMLMAAVADLENRPIGLTSLARPIPIGLDGTIKPKEDGTLYLKVNEATGKLHDNQGDLSVQIETVAVP